MSEKFIQEDWSGIILNDSSTKPKAVGSDESEGSMFDDMEHLDQEKRARAITPRKAVEALTKMLAEHPECADWPMYSDGCDCCEPALEFELVSDAAVGPHVSLTRVED